MQSKKSGFTLIELLVVIAIIGILSSVVLGGLSSAREKGADVAIKSDFANMRSQAAIYYDDPAKGAGTYGVDTSVCTDSGSLFTDPTVANAIVHAQTTSGATVLCFADDGVPGVGTAAKTWAMSVPLKSDPTVSWCVDSTGVAASTTATLIGDVASCQ